MYPGQHHEIQVQKLTFYGLTTLRVSHNWGETAKKNPEEQPSEVHGHIPVTEREKSFELFSKTEHHLKLNNAHADLPNLKVELKYTCVCEGQTVTKLFVLYSHTNQLD